MMKISNPDVKFDKRTGLVTAVVQDYKRRDVLMVAYMNREALAKTLSSGYAHYWSRSRKLLWKKGETSGNVQKVRKILVDCDRDALLILVDQKGMACHTGKRSCFFTNLRRRKRKD